MSTTIALDSQGRTRGVRCGGPVSEETRRSTHRTCMNRTKNPSGRCWRHQ